MVKWIKRLISDALKNAKEEAKLSKLGYRNGTVFGNDKKIEQKVRDARRYVNDRYIHRG